jgi:omega-6 fatty acid desaturase (delta-12 desaturase)
MDIYSTCATLREYRALTPARRWLYRVSRHPFLTQLVLPPFVFLALYRVPFDAPRESWRRERASVHRTNVAIACVLGALMVALGPWQVLLVQGAIMVPASIVGVWLFTVQHRFEEALWSRQESWNATDAALNGSSYLKLPRVLQWFTGNIGFHHVHHLSARVPNYRLQECHEAQPELGSVTTLTLREALFAPCFALWDEELGRMVRFPRAAGPLAS